LDGVRVLFWEEGNLDVNEKIVCAWLASKDYFIINGIDYGQFHSDIDILAVNIKVKKIFDVEVKIRTGSTKISSGDNKQSGFQHFIRQLNSIERNDKIVDVIGNNHGFTLFKYFVTTYSFLGSVANRANWTNKFLDHQIIVLFIEDIVNELEEHANSLALSKDEVIQILRLQNIKNRMK
jgi:hypothetical protein